MASVSQLGYLGIGTRDAKAWQDLATTILGLQVVPGDDTSTSYLRMDEYHHRLELRSTGSDDLEFVGWEVPDPATLQRVAQQLEDGGAKVTPGTRNECDARRVIDLVKCVDPDGIPTEVFCGRPINPQPFLPARPMSGFKTGDMGLGHILVYARSLDETVRFYRDLLGFRVSDFTAVRTPGGTVRLAFLHCNPRHHSIAFLEAPGAPKRINHVMFECNSLDDVGSGRDLCLARGVPIVIDLGRHMNDRMVSFYLANPSGFAVEYGWAGRTIDDTTWQIEHYSAVDSLWGHPQLRDLVNGVAPREK
jgi:2,3-dihydroxybiphenyl 1,2-dioxygenase